MIADFFFCLRKLLFLKLAPKLKVRFEGDEKKKKNSATKIEKVQKYQTQH